MKADEILDNIMAAAEVIAEKLPKVLLINCIKAKSVCNSALLFLRNILFLLLQNWKNVKILHLKTLKSVALPIFTANISNLDELDRRPSLKKQEVKVKKNPKLQTFHKTKLERLVLWFPFMCYSV